MNIILSGCLGRMGKAISELAQNTMFGINIVAGVDKQSQPCHYPIYTSFEHIKEEANGIIDFSHFSMLRQLGEYAKAKNMALLLATTGYSDEDMQYIENLAKHIPVLQTYNLSLSLHVLKHLAAQANKALSGLYDIEIIEKHHNQKADSPSGTAILLYEAVKNENNNAIYGRHGKTSKREANEIGIHAIRGGGLPGEHEVGFYGQNDELQLVHKVRDRKVFAEGALKAIAYLNDKPKGKYTMENVISK